MLKNLLRNYINNYKTGGSSSDDDDDDWIRKLNIPDIPSDTIPCLVPNPETSLEGDMREWIRNQ